MDPEFYKKQEILEYFNQIFATFELKFNFIR